MELLRVYFTILYNVTGIFFLNLSTRFSKFKHFFEKTWDYLIISLSHINFCNFVQIEHLMKEKFNLTVIPCCINLPNNCLYNALSAKSACLITAPTNWQLNAELLKVWNLILTGWKLFFSKFLNAEELSKLWMLWASKVWKGGAFETVDFLSWLSNLRQQFWSVRRFDSSKISKIWKQSLSKVWTQSFQKAFDVERS